MGEAIRFVPKSERERGVRIGRLAIGRGGVCVLRGRMGKNRSPIPALTAPLCLLAALAMLVVIPLTLDEVVAMAPVHAAKPSGGQAVLAHVLPWRA